MVSFSAASSFCRPGSVKSCSTWTEPLPKVCRPTTSARLLFFRAPATISLAEAELLFTMTTSGSRVRSVDSEDASFTSLIRCLSPPPTVFTMTPSERNRSETWIACSSSPPGFPRRSSTSPSSFPPDSFSCSWMVPARSRVVFAENCESFT